MAVSRTPFQHLLACLYFRFRRLILLVKTKKVISMSCGSSTSSWKPWRWVRLDLVFTMRDMYINSHLNPLTKFTSSRETPSLKIFCYGQVGSRIWMQLLFFCKHSILGVRRQSASEVPSERIVFAAGVKGENKALHST